MKKIRFILPALAFLFAFGAALATTSKGTVTTNIPVSLSGECKLAGECNPNGTNNCSSTYIEYNETGPTCGSAVTGEFVI